MRKPADLLNRDAEWTRLVEVAESDGPELCVVMGRRRGGKTYLLTRFAAACRGIYFQATKRTEREQLSTLSRIIGEHFQDPAFKRASFGDWEHLFDYLVERAGGEPLLLVLDEFPYLADAAPALASILQREWDHRLGATRLKLVVCGSHVSAMRRLTEEDQPLFGRRTALIECLPFHYRNAADFAPDFEPRDKLRLYGIFGGLPGHLALVDRRRSLADNVKRLILDPTARLHDEGAHLFDAFLGGAEVHYSIIEAIALGETRWSRVSNRVGRSSSSLLNPITWLTDMGVVQREAPMTEYPNPPRNKMRYRVADPYLVFWHRFVADIRARGLATMRAPQELWKAYIEPRLDQYMGGVFEEACRTFLTHANRPDFPFRPVQVGRWWTEDGQDEVDVVALGPEGEVLLGEAKWGTATDRDLDVLKRRGDLILPRLKGARSVQYALFSGGGQPDDLTLARWEESGIRHFTVEDLFASW